MLAKIDFQQGFQDAWTRVATFLPKLVGFVFILLIGLVIAKALGRILDGLLARVGFDRLVERGSLKAAFERSKVDPSDVMGRIVFWAVFLLVLQLAFGIFGPNPISDLLHGLIAYLPNVFVAVLILVITSALARVATEILTPMLRAVSGGEWIARVGGLAIFVLGVFAALSQLEIAPAIVNGLFYALLVLIVGSGVIAIGGGGIQPARQYLERLASKAEEKAQEVKESADPEAAKGYVADKKHQIES